MKFSKIIYSAFIAGIISSIGIPSAFAATHVTVKPGDTLWKLSQTSGDSLQQIETANPAVQPNHLQIGSSIVLPQASRQITARAGDTLWNLSRQYGVSMAALTASNPSVDPQNIQIGSTIVIPSRNLKATSAAASTQQTNLYAQNLYWLARVIHAEAAGEPKNAQIGVGDVVMHRLHDSGYPNTVHSVVFQKINGHFQFTCVENGTIYHAPDAVSIQAAKDVLNHHTEVVPGAYVFYNPAKTPNGSWVWNQPTIARIGDFIFAK